MATFDGTSTDTSKTPGTDSNALVTCLAQLPQEMEGIENFMDNSWLDGLRNDGRRKSRNMRTSRSAADAFAHQLKCVWQSAWMCGMAPAAPSQSTTTPAPIAVGERIC